MRRRIAKIASVTVVGVAIAVTIAWFFFVHQTQRAIDQWAGTQRENGVEVTWQSLGFSGYPFRVNAQVGEPELIVRQPNRVTTWKSPLLTLKFSSTAPRAIGFSSPGTHNLHLATDDKTWSVVVDAETLKGQALFSPNDYRRIEKLTGRFAGLSVTPSNLVEAVTVDQGNFVVTHRAATPVDPQAVHPQGASFELRLATQDIYVPEDLLRANALDTLDPLINAFSTEFLVNGELNSGSIDINSLTAWRDSGGTVEITSIELHWGPVQIDANGTLALDDDLQPVGSFATQIAGLEQLITEMEISSVLSPSDAAIARTILSILSRRSEDEGLVHVKIPITLQDRTLRLGPVPLVQFKPISWE
jgi:hypothetical protein